MSRKGIISWIGIVAAAVILIGGTIVWSTETIKPSGAQAAGENASYEYILKSYDNKIAVFEKGKESPVRILEVPIDTLPYSEQTALENGVRIKNAEALKKAIEDFTG